MTDKELPSGFFKDLLNTNRTQLCRKEAFVVNDCLESLHLTTNCFAPPGSTLPNHGKNNSQIYFFNH